MRSLPLPHRFFSPVTFFSAITYVRTRSVVSCRVGEWRRFVGGASALFFGGRLSKETRDWYPPSFREEET